MPKFTTVGWLRPPHHLAQPSMLKMHTNKGLTDPSKGVDRTWFNRACRGFVDSKNRWESAVCRRCISELKQKACDIPDKRKNASNHFLLAVRPQVCSTSIHTSQHTRGSHLCKINYNVPGFFERWQTSGRCTSTLPSFHDPA